CPSGVRHGGRAGAGARGGGERDQRATQPGGRRPAALRRGHVELLLDRLAPGLRGGPEGALRCAPSPALPGGSGARRGVSRRLSLPFRRTADTQLSSFRNLGDGIAMLNCSLRVLEWGVPTAPKRGTRTNADDEIET